MVASTFFKYNRGSSYDPYNPLAIKTLIENLQEGQNVMIFPEGRITVTGSIMKVYEGTGMIAMKSGAKIIPLQIDGAQYSPFSYLRGKVKIKWFPRITLTFLEPQEINIPESLSGKKKDNMLVTKFIS